MKKILTIILPLLLLISCEKESKKLIANFSLSETEYEYGETVTFSNTSKGKVSSYFWEFPGGIPETSTKKTPIVRYGKEGKYDVRLTIKNEVGSSVSNKTEFVKVVNNDLEIMYAETGGYVTRTGKYHRTYFKLSDFNISYPVTIKKLDHHFGQSIYNTWSYEKFRFIIYDSYNNNTLLETNWQYALSNNSLNKIAEEHVLSTPLIINRNFYVAIELYNTNKAYSYINIDISGNSHYSNDGTNWTFYSYGEYLTSIFISNRKKSNKVVELSYSK